MLSRSSSKAISRWGAGVAAAGCVFAPLALASSAAARPWSPATGRAHAVSATVKPVANGRGAHAVGVRYSAATVVVPSRVVAADLQSVSSDGSTYTFSKVAAPLGRLKRGSVMLLQGYAVRRVTTASRKGSRLVVATTPAAITDLLTKGSLSWNLPTSFAHAFAFGGSSVPIEATRDAHAQAPVAARFGLASLASGPITISGSTSSYNFKATFKPAANSVGVDITISKSSPVDVSVTISGKLDNLNTAGAISVAHGRTSAAKLVASGVKGQFKVSYLFKPLSQFGLGQAGGIKITLPAEITVPFAVGGVPFFIGIKTAFFASVGFSGFDQAVSGSYTIDYNGHGGFSTSTNGATSALGAIQGLGQILLNAANAVHNGPLTVILGAQVPQIELGLGVKGLNVGGFLTLIADTGVATYGSGCDTRGLLVQASAGAEAKFFGFSVPLGSATIFKKEIMGSYPAGCGVFPGFS